MTKPVVNIADVPLREGGDGAGFVAKLGRVGPLVGAQKLGCQLHVVPAGKKAFPRHAHHANEEMFDLSHSRRRRRQRSRRRRRDGAPDRQQRAGRAQVPRLLHPARSRRAGVSRLQ
jgi:hypothetical protein